MTATAAPWPAGCHEPESCKRNRRCMYFGCIHVNRDITDEIERFAKAPRTVPSNWSPRYPDLPPAPPSPTALHCLPNGAWIVLADISMIAPITIGIHPGINLFGGPAPLFVGCASMTAAKSYAAELAALVIAAKAAKQ